MNLQEKKIREWLQRKRWGTQNGSCYRSVYLKHYDDKDKCEFYVEINPVINPKRVSISICGEDGRAKDVINIPIDDLSRIVELAKLNNDAFEDYNYQRRK